MLTWKNNVLKNTFPIIFVIIIFCLFIYIGFMYNKYIIDTNNIQTRENNISDLEWTFIKSIIYEDYLTATNQAQTIANTITTRIIQEYPDLNQLQTEFDHPNEIFSPRYMYIIESAVSDKYLFGIENDDNDIFVCNKYGIIYDHSKSMQSRLLQDNTDNQNINFKHLANYSWNNVYATSMNPARTKKVINDILSQSQNIFFLEHLAFNADKKTANHSILDDQADLNDLYKLYQQYGIEAFKNIQFLAPAYITPSGDIFGTKDISIYGKQNENYKIIVVQTFNLYQQLMNRYPNEIFKFAHLKNDIINSPLQDINIHGLFIIMIIIMLSILIICFMLFIEKYKKYE